MPRTITKRSLKTPGERVNAFTYFENLATPIDPYNTSKERDENELLK